MFFCGEMCKIFRTPILKNICERLLLKKLLWWRQLKFEIRLLSEAIYAKFRIICLKLAFLRTIAEGGIFRLQSDNKLSCKITYSRSRFSQKLHLVVWLGSKYAFGAFCTEFSTKGNKPLFPLKSALLGKIITNKLAVSSTTETSVKNKIFVYLFLIEDVSMLLYESSALKQLPW